MMGGRRAVRAPAMATSHGIYEDLLFSLVCKSRPRLRRVEPSGGVMCRNWASGRDKDLYRASIRGDWWERRWEEEGAALHEA